MAQGGEPGRCREVRLSGTGRGAREVEGVRLSGTGRGTREVGLWHVIVAAAAICWKPLQIVFPFL